MPLPSLELDKNTCLTRSRGSRHGVVVCRICYVHYSDCVKVLEDRTGYWLRSQLWHVTTASQWRIVEIEFLAMAGWMWDCQPFKDAYVCSMWCAAERRFVGHVCLRNPFLPFKEFQASTPYQKLQVPESHSTLHQFWIIASSPSLCCSCRKNQSYAKNWTIAEIELWSSVGSQRGCQPFSCRCWQNVTQCRKEIYAICLFKESMFLWKSKLPLYQNRGCH